MFGRKKPPQEFLTFRATTGEPVRRPFRRCPVSRTIEYHVVSEWLQTVGDLIDVAVGACPALCDRELLHPSDAGRLCALLDDFRRFPFRTPDHRAERPAESLDATWMRRAAKAWVYSLFAGGEKLMPLFATEAAYFLEAVAHGARCDYPEEATWHLGGRLDQAPPHDDAIHRDKRWKKGFTERLLAITLLVRNDEPLDVRLPSGRTTLPAGSDFKFVVWRSPLSGGVGDRPAFLYWRPELLRETWPYGALVLDEGGNLAGRDATPTVRDSQVEGVIPWRWVVEYVDRRGPGPEWKPVPAFPWTIVS